MLLFAIAMQLIPNFSRINYGSGIAPREKNLKRTTLIADGGMYHPSSAVASPEGDVLMMNLDHCVGFSAIATPEYNCIIMLIPCKPCSKNSSWGKLQPGDQARKFQASYSVLLVSNANTIVKMTPYQSWNPMTMKMKTISRHPWSHLTMMTTMQTIISRRRRRLRRWPHLSNCSEMINGSSCAWRMLLSSIFLTLLSHPLLTVIPPWPLLPSPRRS